MSWSAYFPGCVLLLLEFASLLAINLRANFLTLARWGFCEFPGYPKLGHWVGKFKRNVDAAPQAGAEEFHNAFLRVLVLLIGDKDLLARLYRGVHRKQSPVRIGRDGVGVLIERLAVRSAAVHK